MDPHEPFLKAILASRHDDLPRLVYADWLEETGDPDSVAHAHFIRTQINLESADPRSDLYHELKALEARILDWYLDDWRYDLPEFVRYGSAVEQVKWRRGFPDDLGAMNVREFVEHGYTALIELPLSAIHITDRTTLPVTGARISDNGTSLAFQSFPALAHISRLKLGPSFHPLAPPPPLDSDKPTVMFDSLVSAPVFTSLRQLDLSENHIDDRWLVRFAAAYPVASFAPTLEFLDLSTNFRITDAGANVLAAAAGFDGLKSLRVRDTGITSGGMNMLRKRFGSRIG